MIKKNNLKETTLSKKSKINLDLMNKEKHKKKSISVIIVNTLLIVVAVIIVVIILNFGTDFTQEELNKTTNLTRNYEISNVDFHLVAEAKSNNQIQIRNTSSKNLKIVGYSIISKLNAKLLNNYVDFEEQDYINLNAGGTVVLPIECYPEKEFNLELLFDDGTKAVKKIITTNFDFTRCLVPLYIEPFKREVYSFSFVDYCGDNCEIELIEVKQLHNHGHWETRIYKNQTNEYYSPGMPHLPFGLVFYNKLLRHSMLIGTVDFHLLSPYNLEKAPQLYELIFDVNNYGKSYTINSFLEVEYDYCVPGGDGSEDNPYVVCDSFDLEDMKNDLSAHYVLGADIDLRGGHYRSGEHIWEPIGTYENPFTGSFDGQNHAITNLYIYRPDESFIGLFGVAGTGVNIVNIKNLRLRNVEIYGESSVGSIVGFGYVNLENSSADGDIYASSSGVGGLMGYNSIGYIDSCYSKVNISSSDFHSFEIGGLIGGLGEECPAEELCYILNSYSTGLVSPVNQSTGGLVGWLFNGDVINSFYDSQTSGQPDIGKGVPKTTAQLATRSTFENAGWDFIDTWAIDERFNGNYPYHKDNRPR